MIEKPAYVCEHCGKVTLHKGWMKGHEPRCWLNPALRACKSCGWWFKNLPEYGTKLREQFSGKLPFCSCDDFDYSSSWEGDGYEEPRYEYHEAQKNCPGWRPPVRNLTGLRKILKARNIRKYMESIQ